MPVLRRSLLVAGVLALTSLLAACESFDMDKLDVFGLSEKKKLPGDRKPLFPDGVPGVSQGIPPDLVKGNQPPPDQQQSSLAPEPKAEPAPKAAEQPAAPKRKPKPRVVRVPASEPAKVTVQPAAQQPAQPQAPWPSSNQQQTQGAQSPWPSTTPQQNAPWPAAPQPGTFSR